MQNVSIGHLTKNEIYCTYFYLKNINFVKSHTSREMVRESRVRHVIFVRFIGEHLHAQEWSREGMVTRVS